MKRTESKWCPECEEYSLHVKGWCLGCDIDDEVWHDKTVDEVIASISASGVNWTEKKWVVALFGQGPLYAVGTKKEGVGRIKEAAGVESISMSRVAPGLYQWVHQISEEDHGNSKIYYVGKPDVYEEQELCHLLDPDSE